MQVDHNDAGLPYSEVWLGETKVRSSVMSCGIGPQSDDDGTYAFALVTGNRDGFSTDSPEQIEDIAAHLFIFGQQLRIWQNAEQSKDGQ